MSALDNIWIWKTMSEQRGFVSKSAGWGLGFKAYRVQGSECRGL